MGEIVNFIIDPPWPHKKGGLRSSRPNQGRDLDYKTLTIPEIFQLLDNDVFPLATSSHNVWLWGIDKYLCAGEAEMVSRGYKLHTQADLGQRQWPVSSLYREILPRVRFLVLQRWSAKNRHVETRSGKDCVSRKAETAQSKARMDLLSC